MLSERQEQNMQHEPTKKAALKETNRIFFALFCIAAAQYLVPAAYEMMTHTALDDSVKSVIVKILVLCIILLFRGPKLFRYDMRVVERKMSAAAFTKLFICILAVQTVMASCLHLAEQALNGAGYTLYGGTVDTRVDTIPILVIVSGVLIGPLFEEIVFRGAALRMFESGGKVFAVLISSLAFGIYHRAFAQGFFAIFAGLVFAYAAIEYSFKWALLLHCLNNFMAGGLNMVVSNIPDSGKGLIDYGVPALFLALAIVIVIKDRKEIGRFIKNNPAKTGLYRQTLRSVWLWTFLAGNFIWAVAAIQKL